MAATPPESLARWARGRRDAGGAPRPPGHGDAEEPCRRHGPARGAPPGALAARRDGPDPGGGAGRSRRAASVGRAPGPRTDGAVTAAQPPLHGGDRGHLEPRHRRHDGSLLVRRRHPAVAALLPAAGPVDDRAARHPRAGAVSALEREPPLGRCVAPSLRDDLPGAHGAAAHQRARYRRRNARTTERSARPARLLRAAAGGTAARTVLSGRRRNHRERQHRRADARAVAAPLRRRPVGAGTRHHPR